MFEPTTLAWTEADIFQWLDMPAGFRVSGPAVVEHPETTVYIGPGHGSTGPAIFPSISLSACPGKVGTGFPTRTCAK
jgi:hypothetical protein